MGYSGWDDPIDIATTAELPAGGMPSDRPAYANWGGGQVETARSSTVARAGRRDAHRRQWWQRLVVHAPRLPEQRQRRHLRAR